MSRVESLTARVLTRAERDRTGWLSLAVAAAVCAVAALILWWPLGLLPDLVSAFFTQGRCTEPAGSVGSYLCGVRFALIGLSGPVLALGLVIIYREHISRAVAGLVRSVPRRVRFLIAPVLCTAVFSISWAGAHFGAPLEWGLLPNIIFAAIVGIAGFVLSRWDPWLRARLAPLLTRRDRLGRRARYALALAAPLALGLLLTFGEPVTASSLKEQVIVIAGLICAYVALVPRTGDLLEEAHRLGVPKVKA
jgi:hypothetical protein